METETNRDRQTREIHAAQIPRKSPHTCTCKQWRSSFDAWYNKIGAKEFDIQASTTTIGLSIEGVITRSSS